MSEVQDSVVISSDMASSAQVCHETETGNIVSNHREAVQPHCCHLEHDHFFFVVLDVYRVSV